MKIKFFNTFWQLVRASRPVHWIKNLALFAALVFSGNLLNINSFIKVIYAMIAFNFATSATYLFNDIFDAPRDRLHPFKKNRPIAAGLLPVPIAIVGAIFLTLAAFYISSYLNTLFFFLVFSYLFMQVIYSTGLKNIPIIDILIIASGFIIRVYSGAFVIDAHLSVWFLLCVISVALFLAAGKRRAELNIKPTKGTTRKSLSKYDSHLLNSYVTNFGNAAWMSWSLFTFFESPKVSTPFWLFLAELSRTTTISKLMMITIPFVIYAIMRYELLIFAGKSETPEKLILTDKPLLASVGSWFLLVFWILYSGISVS